MLTNLLCQIKSQGIWTILAIIVILLFLIFLFIVGRFIKIWIQAFTSGGNVMIIRSSELAFAGIALVSGVLVAAMTSPP